MQNKFKNKKGFALVEVVIASAIIGVAFVAFATVAQQSVYLSNRLLHQTQATFLMQEGQDAVKSIRDRSWSTTISTYTNGTTYYLFFDGTKWTLQTTPVTSGIFTRTITFAQVLRDATTKDIGSGTADTGTRYVTVNVTWPQPTTKSSGTNISKNLYFYISNILND